MKNWQSVANGAGQFDKMGEYASFLSLRTLHRSSERNSLVHCDRVLTFKKEFVGMFLTPASLLYRLRSPDDSRAWDRFVDLYSPLLFHWAKKLGYQDSDASDLVQDVFLILWQKLPQFEYNANQSFHAWLKVIFLNRFRSIKRKLVPATMESGSNLCDSDAEIILLDDEEDRQYLYHKALTLIECEFSELYIYVFRTYVLEEGDPQAIAVAMGISIGTVYSIKSKILSRLRQEVREIL